MPNKYQSYLEILKDLTETETLSDLEIIKTGKQPETSLAFLKLKDSTTLAAREAAAMEIVDILTTPRPNSPSWSFK